MVAGLEIPFSPNAASIHTWCDMAGEAVERKQATSLTIHTMTRSSDGFVPLQQCLSLSRVKKLVSF